MSEEGEDLEALDRLFEALGPAPTGHGRLTLLVVRKPGERRETPSTVELCAERGVVGDRWFLGAERSLEEQVTMMSSRVLQVACRFGARPELAGDNLVVDLDLSEETLPAGSRLRIGPVLLEVNAKPHTGCKKFSARFGSDTLRWTNNAEGRRQRRRGIHCRVLKGGVVELGARVEVQSLVASEPSC